MADSFVPVTFVADELLTSTKMNLLAANQAGFHDGTALGDGIIVTRHLKGPEDLVLGSYSSSEQATRFKWVDGKTIFRRTFSGVITAPSTNRVITILSVPGIDNIVHYEGYLHIDGSGYTNALGSGWGGSATNSPMNNYSGLQRRPNEVYLLSQYDGTRTSSPYVVTLFYTKT